MHWYAFLLYICLQSLLTRFKQNMRNVWESIQKFLLGRVDVRAELWLVPSYRNGRHLLFRHRVSRVSAYHVQVPKCTSLDWIWEIPPRPCLSYGESFPLHTCVRYLTFGSLVRLEPDLTIRVACWHVKVEKIPSKNLQSWGLWTLPDFSRKERCRI